jgi:hypothetical protein
MLVSYHRWVERADLGVMGASPNDQRLIGFHSFDQRIESSLIAANQII